jgi:hypothetical protein
MQKLSKVPIRKKKTGRFKMRIIEILHHPRRFKSQYQQQTTIERPQEEEGFRRETPFRRYSSSQVSNYFSWFMLFM